MVAAPNHLDRDHTVPPILRIEKGSFSHGSRLIFQEVNLEVRPGEALCVLGPNGSGKTTLIDCLLGHLRLSQGEVFLYGEPVSRMSPAWIARNLSYVPQNHARHFSFTVMDILLMGRTPYTKFYQAPDDADREKAAQLLASLDLTDLAHRDYTRLSGGETQLVMILRALVQETPVILMDEPTAHLDFKNELMVLETITRLVRQRGLTLIMATHFPNHAFFLENAGIPVEVAFMDRHGVCLAGCPSQALTQENLERFYGVCTEVTSFQVPGMGTLRQVIPLKTLEKKR